MAQHVDILDQRDPIKRGFAGSVALHGAIAVLAAVWSIAGASQVEQWGDPKSLGGGSTVVTPVAGIRLPRPIAPINPVANDTESQVPAPPPKPVPQAKPPAPKPDPDAIPLKSRNATRRAEPAPQQRYSPSAPKPNQVYSQTGRAASSPLFTQAPGGGGVGSGSGSPFGYRFGFYEQLIREQVARNWRSQDLDSRIRTRVAISFEILRNGSLRNIRVTQSSGNFTMDQSALRAITLSNPLPPLPAGFERDVAVVEFWFGLTQ
jgi:protein TonB